jgi:2-(1,2-epoxy-1,2-dihydrophenyl)acetyl-CoA isomerase
MDAPVLVDRKGAVAYLTLNRPDTGNAIDVALARCLLEAVVAVEADPLVRCIVLRSRGRLFCAGGDVKALHAAKDDLPELLGDILRYLHPALERLACMDKPVVTAINGPCAGAGVGLAAVGDIALAEPAAHFTMAYSRIGLSPDGGATWLLPRLVGMRRAQEMALTNRRVSADEAAAMGLITRVVSPGALGEDVEAVAQDLACSAVGAIGKIKRLLLADAGRSLTVQLYQERDAIVEQGGTAEAKEGIGAFAERRAPDFIGKAGT